LTKEREKLNDWFQCLAGEMPSEIFIAVSSPRAKPYCRNTVKTLFSFLKIRILCLNFYSVEKDNCFQTSGSIFGP